MNSGVSESTALQDGYPLLRILVSFPIACFTCALLTDIAYMWTANIMWADFSAWLLAAGLAGGALATLAGMVSWLAGRRGQTQRRTWIIALGGMLTLVVALFNNFVHSRDAWTSVVPMGLALSAVAVLVMLMTVWLAFVASRRRITAMSNSGVGQ